jgi:hypothetical protein
VQDFLSPEKNATLSALSIKVSKVWPNIYIKILKFLTWLNKYIMKLYLMTNLIIFIWCVITIYIDLYTIGQTLCTKIWHYMKIAFFVGPREYILMQYFAEHGYWFTLSTKYIIYMVLYRHPMRRIRKTRPRLGCLDS